MPAHSTLPETALEKLKTGLKSRRFSGEGPDAIIRAVNGWLQGETGITVRHTETKPATDMAPMEFCVWYDQEDNAP